MDLHFIHTDNGHNSLSDKVSNKNASELNADYMVEHWLANAIDNNGLEVSGNKTAKTDIKRRNVSKGRALPTSYLAGVIP